MKTTQEFSYEELVALLGAAAVVIADAERHPDAEVLAKLPILRGARDKLARMADLQEVIAGLSIRFTGEEKRE